jgi:hypothetical protein
MLEMLRHEFPECASELTLDYATDVCREIINTRRMDGNRVRKEIDSLFERGVPVDKRKIDAGMVDDGFIKTTELKAAGLVQQGPPQLKEQPEQNNRRMFWLLYTSRLDFDYWMQRAE